MLSEYEQNLIKEKEGPVTAAYRKARKWSLVRQQSSSLLQGKYSRGHVECNQNIEIQLSD